MKPWFAVCVLSVLCCFTMTCYFLAIPEALRRKGVEGRWGMPDAEFNWCEPDYQLVDWVAEPVNTASNTPFVLLPIGFIATHRASRDLVVIALLQVFIGVGSMLFHASLRYPMQLLDEVPMLWFTLASMVCYLRRLKGVDLAVPAVAVGVSMALGILATTQHSRTHELWRGLMTSTFCVCLVAMGWGSTAMVGRLQEEVTGKRRHVPVKAERMHTFGFVCFVLAVLSWLSDNYFCPALWRLPLGLPYPHLHSWWHLFTAATLHCLLLLFQLYDRQASPALDLRLRLWLLPSVDG